MNRRQTWDPDQYAREARFVSDLGAPVVDLCKAQFGEDVLDLGCGDGALTERFVAAGCRVVAVDSSPEQIWAARGRGLDAKIIDATELSFHERFDVVFSNAVLHWISAPEMAGVIEGVWNALRPGGRFVAELGGHGCVQSVREGFKDALTTRGIDVAAHDPWYFPTADDFHTRLESRGFRIDSIATFPRPTPLRSDVTRWLEIFAKPFLSAVSAAERRGLLEDVRTFLEPRLRTAEGVWVVDYVRLRFAVTKPPATTS